jgi:hypothetical protein
MTAMPQKRSSGGLQDSTEAFRHACQRLVEEAPSLFDRRMRRAIAARASPLMRCMISQLAPSRQFETSAVTVSLGDTADVRRSSRK